MLRTPDLYSRELVWGPDYSPYLLNRTPFFGGKKPLKIKLLMVFRSGVFIKKNMIFHVFALLPPTLVVCPRVNFCAHLSSRLAQLFSRCLSELLGMWALSTSRERPIMKANEIRLRNCAHTYAREFYSCNVIGRPRCLSTALNRFVPRSQLSFSSFFHQNRNDFLSPTNLYEVNGRELEWVWKEIPKSLLAL